ncbi:Uncharacterised protein [Segatella copri]|nr:Uncharacterised protein [Segatella copri]
MAAVYPAGPLPIINVFIFSIFYLIVIFLFPMARNEPFSLQRYIKTMRNQNKNTIFFFSCINYCFRLKNYCYLCTRK